MAINQSRSMNSDLRKGATEGKYKDLRPNTGGERVNDAANLSERAALHPDYGYGLRVEAPVKVLPDGTRQ